MPKRLGAVQQAFERTGQVIEINGSDKAERWDQTQKFHQSRAPVFGGLWAAEAEGLFGTLAEKCAQVGIRTGGAAACSLKSAAAGVTGDTGQNGMLAKKDGLRSLPA